MLTAEEWQVLGLSAQVALGATLLCLVPGVWLGWLLARKQFAGKALVEAVIFLPMVLPPVVPGYLLLMAFGSQGPLGAWLLEHFGLQLAFDWKGAVLAAAVIALPLMVQSARLAVQLIDPRLEWSASTLGARPWRVWCTVTLPLMAPGVLVGALMVFSRALGEFGATITFVGNIPGETRTLALAIYSASQQIDGEGAALRLMVLCLALALGALLLSQWLSRRAERLLGHGHA